VKADSLSKQSHFQMFVFQHLTNTWSQMGQIVSPTEKQKEQKTMLVAD